MIELADLADHLRKPRARPLDQKGVDRAIAVILRGDLPVSVRSLDMTQ